MCLCVWKKEWDMVTRNIITMEYKSQWAECSGCHIWETLQVDYLHPTERWIYVCAVNHLRLHLQQTSLYGVRTDIRPASVTAVTILGLLQVKNCVYTHPYINKNPMTMHSVVSNFFRQNFYPQLSHGSWIFFQQFMNVDRSEQNILYIWAQSQCVKLKLLSTRTWPEHRFLLLDQTAFICETLSEILPKWWIGILKWNAFN